MSLRRPQVALLAALAVALVFLLVRNLALGGGDVQRVLRGEESPVSAADYEVVGLRIGDLDRRSGEFRPGRDPWRFGARRLAQEVRTPPPVRPPRTFTPPPVVPVDVGAIDPTPPRPRPPDVDVVFLGSFGPSRQRIAVFSDEEAVYNASLGEVVKGKFVVDQIGFESVDLKFVGFPDVPPERLEVGG